jgi:hypothetical protein
MRFTVLLLFALAACSGPAETPSETQSDMDMAQTDTSRDFGITPVGPGPAPGTAYADVQVGDCQTDAGKTICAGEIVGNIVKSMNVRIREAMAIQFSYPSDAEYANRIVTGSLVTLHLAPAPPMMGDAVDPVWAVLAIR